MKLELKHLAPYLPYGLKVSRIHTLHGHTGIGSIEHIVQAVNEGKSQFKPILRPLSDLTKEIEVNGEKFVPMKWFESNINKSISFYLPINKNIDLQIDIETENYSQTVDLFDGYTSVEKLFSWHFDVFGLIDKGLAIDINTIDNGRATN